ncbi:MAG TPA: ornithine carbamoyltransferase [Bacteroidota bacterium]|jgi:ornithine carbamoyltransferase|nr:ornithine carbamoyltransferase [Bacteroidota bacterium]
MKHDFLSIADVTGHELLHLLDVSSAMKRYRANYYETLRNRSVALIFEKQSLRTHVTFDVGIHQLGGHPVYLTQADINLGKRESVYDTAKNLERWVDAVVVRTFAHGTCVDLAGAISIPVVNALTDQEHPCQAVGDFLTIREKLGDLKNKKFVFVGDGNNVCHSLMLMAAKLGMTFIAATPRGYTPDMNVFKIAVNAARESGAVIDISHHPPEAVKHADIVYTDVWVSMGQEQQSEERLEVFREFQVNRELLSHAKHHALFMHCLPAHRGQEVTDEVIDSSQSIVFDQAENRLHSEKAILVTLMNGD